MAAEVAIGFVFACMISLSQLAGETAYLTKTTAHFRLLSTAKSPLPALAGASQVSFLCRTVPNRSLVLPPIWKRWWFESLAVALVTGTVFAAHRYRVTQMVNLERMRTWIARSSSSSAITEEDWIRFHLLSVYEKLYGHSRSEGVVRAQGDGLVRAHGVQKPRRELAAPLR